jgi:hypothetical protein
MNLDDLLNLAKARVLHLEQLRQVASQQGDVTTIARLEAEIAATQATIAKLQTLG